MLDSPLGTVPTERRAGERSLMARLAPAPLSFSLSPLDEGADGQAMARSHCAIVDPYARPTASGRPAPVTPAGFGLAELVVVLAVISLLIAAGLPYLLVYTRTATLAAGVQEVRDALGRAKQLAITTRQNICIEVAANTTYRFRQATCAGTAWTGVGTNSSGFFRLQNQVRVSNAGGSPIFTALGTASPGATFSVIAPNGSIRTVTVTGGGRITSP